MNTRMRPSPAALHDAPQRQLWCWLLLGLALLLAAVEVAAQARPEASLDRESVELGDAVTLTINIPTSSPPGEPDWTLLEQNFQTVAPRRSTQHVLRNGRAHSATQWQITLLPRRTGTLYIPSLAVGPASTEPLQLEVRPASATREADQPVFLEAELERDSVYVQQQLLLTVRVFHAVPLAEMQLSEPEFSQATVQKVSQNQYMRVVDNTTYQVHELRYAIFPEEPGELIIPELAFRALQPTRPRSLFHFPGQGRPVHKLTAQIAVTVKPVPAAFTGPVWLPATNLTLVERWSESPRQLVAGQSVTRTLTVQANGLPAAYLPPLPQPDINNVRVYPDQPQLDDQTDERGVQGSRSESAALIATEAGRTELPGVKVIWWDVASDSQKEAVISGQTLAIAAPTTQTSAIAEPLAGAEANQPDPASGSQRDPISTEADLEPAAPKAPAFGMSWWILLALALVTAAWAVTLLAYWRLRRSRQSPPPAPTEASSDELGHFESFRKHCRGGEPEPARRSLLAWARTHYNAPTLRSTRQLLAHLRTPQAHNEVEALDARLFGAGTESTLAGHGDWQGNRLLEAIDSERKATGRSHQQQQPLSPLYPSS